MPKNIHNIKTFLTGIVSSPDAKDIPEDAAESSLNIDPVSSDGRLQSIGGDEQIIQSSPSSNFGQPDVADFVNIDGKRLLVGASILKNQILTLDNFHNIEGTTEFNAQNVNNVLNPSIIVHNNESYIGLGAEGAEKPKFVGKALNENVQNFSVDDVIIEDAENKMINVSYYKIDKLATTIPATDSIFGNDKSEEIKYIWGVGIGNKFLYKITVDESLEEGTISLSNTIQDSNGANIDTNIVSIATCISQNNMLWATGEDGNIYRLHVNGDSNTITIETIITPFFNKEEFLDSNNALSNNQPPIDAILSDIIEIRGSQSGDQLNHQLVISYYKEEGFLPNENYLYSRTLTPWDSNDIVEESNTISLDNINDLSLDVNNNITTRIYDENFIFRNISTIFPEVQNYTLSFGNSQIVSAPLGISRFDQDSLEEGTIITPPGQPNLGVSTYTRFEYNDDPNRGSLKTLNAGDVLINNDIHIGKNLGFERQFKLKVSKFGLVATNESSVDSNDVYVHLHCKVDKAFCTDGGIMERVSASFGTGNQSQPLFKVVTESSFTTFPNGFFISTKANKNKVYHYPSFLCNSHNNGLLISNLSCIPYDAINGGDLDSAGDALICKIATTDDDASGGLDLFSNDDPIESIAIDRFNDRNALAMSNNTYNYSAPADNENLCFLSQSTRLNSSNNIDGVALHVLDFDSINLSGGDVYSGNLKSGIDILIKGKNNTSTFIESKETNTIGGSSIFPIFNTATGNGGAGSNLYRIWQFALHTASTGYANGIQDTAVANVNFNDFSGNFTSKQTSYTSFVFNEIPSTGKNAFEANSKLHYALAVVFDNGSVSKLSQQEHPKTVGGSAIDALKIKIRININDISPRAVALQLYRRGIDSDGDKETQYHLAMNDISLLRGWSLTPNTTFVEKVVKDNGEQIGLYQDIAGLSLNSVTMETLPNYGISTVVNNKHIIGHCFSNQLGNMPNRLFASLPGRYNSFKLDDELNTLLLPSKPTALKGFNGRLFAFEDNKMFIINTDAMIIEDQLEGIGCLSQESVVVTEFGMFTANNSNIYHYTGESTIPIASSILKSNNNIGWLERDPTFDPLVAFNSKRDSLIVLFKQPILLSDEEIQQYVLDFLEQNPTLDVADILTTLTNWFCWVYNLRLKRWDLWEVPPNVEPLSIVADKNGDIVMATNGGLFKYATDENNKRKWEWVSKQITLGEDNKSKKYYKVKTHSNTDEEFLQYSVDKGEFIEGLNINKKAKSLQVKIDSEDPNLEVDSISIPYRNLPNSKQNL